MSGGLALRNVVVSDIKPFSFFAFADTFLQTASFFSHTERKDRSGKKRKEIQYFSVQFQFPDRSSRGGEKPRIGLNVAFILAHDYGREHTNEPFSGK